MPRPPIEAPASPVPKGPITAEKSRWLAKANAMTAMEFLPVLFMVAGIVLVAAATLFVSSLLRPSNPYPEKNAPYECGMEAAGEAAGGRFRVPFFILAILLVVFDVEAMFLFPWAVVLKEIGFVGYIEMFVFMLLLLVGFAYAWLKGALEWQE